MGGASSPATTGGAVRHRRHDFVRFLAIPTRWHDNDVYGHVNNVVYYAFFDTVVNRMLVDEGLLDPATSTTVSVVAETSCRYFDSIAFPDVVDAGIAVEHLGRSSVRYRIGIFKREAREAAAQGHFVHVCVDRRTMRPTALPEAHRAVLDTLRLPGG